MSHHIIPAIIIIGLAAAIYVIGRMHGRQAAEDAAEASDADTGDQPEITPQAGGGGRPVPR